ncbi:glutathione S-transferase family protein [Salinarimonas ramus]|uniref:Glutathione S-transferase n=1 Tax=Salinarimonas ramus TaxID=690164 RepID=A0A917V8K7_9HYPH|nr:glutathione S-transferase family protein [Salinarimonas ramus]GGK49219.1 glutathione S-transferase [Salinarimonas ramus]
MMHAHPEQAAPLELPSNTRLIGSPICPFVARARIVAHEKGIALPVEFIDLFAKPDWFLARSPTGTVPALECGDDFIFESSVISEFLDELTPDRLHPTAPVARALNRSWIEFAGTILRQQYFMLIAPGMDDARRHRDGLTTALRQLETIVQRSGPYFNGADFAIIDAAYAPAFVRCGFMTERLGIDVLADLPKLRDWAASVIERPSVRDVHDGEHFGHLTRHLAQRGSAFA